MSAYLEALVGGVFFYRATVEAKIAGAVYDPTGDVVSFAFADSAQTPDEAGWTPGVWEVAEEGYVAMCLVAAMPISDTKAAAIASQDHVELLEGSYNVYVDVMDVAEMPREKVGALRIRAT